MYPYEDVLRFWFGGDPAEPFAHKKKWWTKDPAFDEKIRERFASWIPEARAGKLEHWKADDKGVLAFILLLDQFPRNLFRERPEAFASDDQALGTVLRGLDAGTDYRLGLVERYFFYMPLMHSEDLERQEQSVQKFGVLAEAAPIELKSHFEDALDYAKRHRDIVAEFGRFPHRNAVLGRPCSPAELEFLKRPGSSF